MARCSRRSAPTLIDKKGNITAQVTPKCTQVLEFAQKLVKFYPDDAVSYDDASNNRALISGKSALIFNPPSAWAVAKRDAPHGGGGLLDVLGADGSEGPLRADADVLLGRLEVQPEQVGGEGTDRVPDAARAGRAARSTAIAGYDMPPFAGLLDFKIWEEVEPPKGTVYNYPIRPWHNAKPSLTAAEASPDVAVQIYNRADPQPDDGAAEGGPDDQAGARLGAGRAGRLHPLTVSAKLAQRLALHNARQPLALAENKSDTVAILRSERGGDAADEGGTQPLLSRDLALGAVRRCRIGAGGTA